MARKRSGGRGRRARAYRAPEFRVTCKGCGKVQKMPEKPLPGVEMFCLECFQTKDSANKAVSR